MTLTEACTLVYELTCELAATRAERNGYRLVATAAVRHSHALLEQLERARTMNDHLRNEIREMRQTARVAA